MNVIFSLSLSDICERVNHNPVTCMYEYIKEAVERIVHLHLYEMCDFLNKHYYNFVSDIQAGTEVYENCVRIYGSQHLNTAITLMSLARLHKHHGNLPKAEELYQKSLKICVRVLDPDDPKTAITVESLAHILLLNGEHDKAISLYERALAVRERTFGNPHATIISLYVLAEVHIKLAKYQKAEQLLNRALKRCELLGTAYNMTILIVNRLYVINYSKGYILKALQLLSLRHPHCQRY